MGAASGRRRWLALGLAVSGLIGTGSAVAASREAEEVGGTLMDEALFEEQFSDRFRLSVGGYVISRFSATTSLSSTTSGAGFFVDPERTFGLDVEQTVARIDGYYRFNDRHSLNFSYYGVDTTGTRTTKRDFLWVDEGGDLLIVPAGSSIRSTFNYDILKLGYDWSFYHTDKVELSIGGGLHTTRIDLDLRSNIGGEDDDIEDANVLTPLPVVSVGLHYNISPRLSWGARSEFFSLDYDDIDASYTNSTLSLNYRVADHFAVGAGIGSNAFRVEQETSGETFRFDNRITGLFLNLAYTF